ncbi:hypothetical protein D3C78_1876010 [compost metagenome]
MSGTVQMVEGREWDIVVEAVGRGGLLVLRWPGCRLLPGLLWSGLLLRLIGRLRR